MRILSGKLKGLKILTNNEKFKDSNVFITRPTSDRVKETLFNIMQHGFRIDFSKVSFLDCFSGSGAVGFEAISRGCTKVSFIEKNSVACECIAENLENFKLYKTNHANSFNILNYDFFDKKLSSNNKFDVVFLDPPYELMKAGKVFVRLKELRVIKIDSLIVFESNRELVKTNGIEILRSRKIGKTHLNFLKVFNW